MNIKLRDPNIIMKLSRLGSFHQSKLSFLRSFLNEFKDWDYNRDLFDLNKKGYGTAVYSFKKKDRVYSLICFANKINDHERSDRVIATKWDAAFALHDGIPKKKDIERLRNEVPKQEVGRLSYKELTLSRANKSVRIFEHVVQSLSNGVQPNLNLLDKVGYLYRTTAVYGSGKFGLADRFRIKNREEINGPFRLEMMLVYLVRQFTFDQVNHVAKNRNPKKAIKLDPHICKNLGIGNSTGLGMAPFIVNHPTLLNNWIFCRETALKKIRELKKVDKKDSNLFKNCVRNSIKNITSWNTDSEYQLQKINLLLHDVRKFLTFLEKKFDGLRTNNIKILYDMGGIYKSFEKYDEAIKIYSKLLDLLDNRSKAYADILYRRGGSFERIGDYETADKDLLESLNITRENPYVLNYLAYSWLERNYKIELSMEMLKEAYDLKKNDPYITDSLGWGYYLINDFENAEKYLKKAVELMPYDPIVNDHYGDILWMLNRKIQARYFWNNVLNLDETDDEMKIDVKKKIIYGIEKT